jgi:S-adenosylmethionine/arginine decarboxylase-like enzyme
VAVDIFSCGVEDPGSALAVFRQALAPDREEVTTAVRGREVG